MTETQVPEPSMSPQADQSVPRTLKSKWPLTLIAGVGVLVLAGVGFVVFRLSDKATTTIPAARSLSSTAATLTPTASAASAPRFTLPKTLDGMPAATEEKHESVIEGVSDVLTNSGFTTDDPIARMYTHGNGEYALIFGLPTIAAGTAADIKGILDAMTIGGTAKISNLKTYPAPSTGGLMKCGDEHLSGDTGTLSLGICLVADDKCVEVLMESYKSGKTMAPVMRAAIPGFES